MLGSHGVHFNVSHSDGTALVAIASAEIGVDIERIDGSVDYAGVAQSVFSRSEIEMLRNASDARRGEVFFSIWTRKEAYLKATGAGFSSDLPKISTASSHGVIEDLGCTTGRRPHWHAFDLPAPANFKAALVTTAKDCTIDFVDVADMAQLPVHDATACRCHRGMCFLARIGLCLHRQETCVVAGAADNPRPCTRCARIVAWQSG